MIFHHQVSRETNQCRGKIILYHFHTSVYFSMNHHGVGLRRVDMGNEDTLPKDTHVREWLVSKCDECELILLERNLLSDNFPWINNTEFISLICDLLESLSLSQVPC